ncbi:MAG: hypothetical protein JWP48_6338 [Actinoallomurus sp.]|nr:hypothetical protein [Actinoallomurus sp.]
MRAWLGWVAALLLIALGFTGGPDRLDTRPQAPQATAVAAEIAEKRDPQVRDDDTDVRHQIVDRGTPAHLRLPALPPSPQTAAPVPVKGAALAAPGAAPPAVVEGGLRPHLGACTPEALQIFRC